MLGHRECSDPHVQQTKALRQFLLLLFLLCLLPLLVLHRHRCCCHAGHAALQPDAG